MKDDRWDISPPVRVRMVEAARELRRQPTPSEALLWKALRARQLEGRRFRRQQPIGVFVVDFFCATERLIVEIDGSIHKARTAQNRERQELLESLGLRFVRIPASQVEENLEQALVTIRAAFVRPPADELG